MVDGYLTNGPCGKRGIDEARTVGLAALRCAKTQVARSDGADVDRRPSRDSSASVDRAVIAEEVAEVSYLPVRPDAARRA